jgi:hypothetical protein
MATSNFHNVNATHIFACSLEDEWDYDDLKGNVYYDLKKIDGFTDRTKSDPHELRSFPSQSIGAVSRVTAFPNFTLEVTVTAVARGGYYEGCNLDWHVCYEIDGDSCDTDEFENYIEYSLRNSLNEDEYTKADVVAYAMLAENNAERLKNEIVKEIEQVFKDYSEPLGVTARFSNGETIYHKIA